jgi:hypothetical protein
MATDHLLLEGRSGCGNSFDIRAGFGQHRTWPIQWQAIIAEGKWPDGAEPGFGAKVFSLDTLEDEVGFHNVLDLGVCNNFQLVSILNVIK